MITVSTRLILYVFAFFGLMVIADTAHARLKDGRSTSEDVAIAFFKTGGGTPDFTAWAQHHPDFNITPRMGIPALLASEEQRLIGVWNAYDPRAPITIRTEGMVELMTGPDKEGKDSYTMKITLPGGDAAYFPYEYAGNKFAVIPQKLEQIHLQTMPKEQFDLIYRNLGGKLQGNVRIFVELIPFQAYIDRPYPLDGIDQWVLVSDIASLAILPKRGENPLWSYSAPWYVAPKTQQLRDLYHSPDTGPVTPATP